MVGVETALADDPALTVRLPGLDRKPLRVVLDTHLRLPLRSRLADQRARPSDARHRRRGRAGGRGPAPSRPRRDRSSASPSTRRAMSISGRRCGRSPRVGSRACSAKAARLLRPGSLRSRSPTRSRLITADKPLGRSGRAGAERGGPRDARRPLALSAGRDCDLRRGRDAGVGGAGIGVTARFTGSVKAASATALRQGERQGGQVMKGIEAVILREVHLVGWDIVKCAF